MEQNTESKTNRASPGQYLTFMLKGQDYGVPIATVREINRVSDITPVPDTPPYVMGVINLRGKVIPVVDLRLKFRMEKTTATRETCIIVIEAEGGQVGMIVDSVREVIELSDAQIEPPPMLGEDTKSSFVMGMGKVENRVVILVDIVRTLSPKNLLGESQPDQNAA